MWLMWKNIKDVLEYLGKNTAVTELGLDTLSREEGAIPNGKF